MISINASNIIDHISRKYSISNFSRAFIYLYCAELTLNHPSSDKGRLREKGSLLSFRFNLLRQVTQSLQS